MLPSGDPPAVVRVHPPDLPTRCRCHVKMHFMSPVFPLDLLESLPAELEWFQRQSSQTSLSDSQDLHV